MIEFLDIGKSCNGVPVIEGLNLKIERGEFVVIIGPSGSGQSTLLKMIKRMQTHDAGKILSDGEEIFKFNVRDLRLRMGYAIQSVGLFPHGTVARNIGTVPHSDIGIKLLSLPPARDCACKEPTGAGLALPADTNLREVVSFMSMQHLAHVNLVDAVGLHAGVPQAVDIFEKPAGGGSHGDSDGDRRNGGA